MHDVFVDAVFNKWRSTWRVEQSLSICFVFSEQEFRTPFTVEPALAQLGVFQLNRVLHNGVGTAQMRFCIIVVIPGPCVAKPNCRQETQMCWFRSTINGTNANQNVLDACLRILNEHIEVAVFVEDSGVNQLKFGSKPTALAILLNQ